MKKGPSNPVPPDIQAEIDALAASQEPIRTDLIPEATGDWSDARRRVFYRPIKQQITLRLDAELAHANFSNANLTKTVLHRANLEGASFTDANLKGAVLAKATLKKTDFTGADLKGAFFTGADLSGAKPFSEKQLGQAKFCHTTMPDGKGNDRNCAEFNKMDLNDFYNSYLSP